MEHKNIVATIYIKDGRITFQPFSEGEEFEVIDAGRRLIMPGLINMHTHSYMTMMRNYADDVPFQEWLFNRVMPVEDNLPVEAAYWTSMLGSDSSSRATFSAGAFRPARR